MTEFAAPPAPRPTVTYANCTVAEYEGFRPLHLDLHVPPGEGPFPVLLWIHGGGWHWGSRVSLPETIDRDGFYGTFLAHGYAVADIDYRLATEAPWPAQMTDVHAAIRWLRHFAGELKLDSTRFAALGESAGAHIAAMAALVSEPQTAIQAVVFWYGPADFSWIPQDITEGNIAKLFRGALQTMPDFVRSASPMHRVSPDSPPFLLVHGTADTLVPYQESEKLATALRQAGVRADLVPVEGAEHCFEGHNNIRGLIEQCAQFLDDVLKRQ